MTRISVFLFLLLSLNPILSSGQSNSTLQLSEIMKGKDFIGYWPENHYWNIGVEKVIYYWNPKNELESSLFSYSISTKKIEPVDQNDPHASIGYDYEQANYTNQYYSIEGNLFVWDKKTKKCKPIISNNSGIFNVQRLTDPNKIVYQEGNNLYLYDATLGSIKKLTQVEKGAKSLVTEEKKDVLDLQQEELFLYIREQKELKKYRDEKYSNKKVNSLFYLDAKRLDFFRISKDGKYIFMATSDNPSSKETHVENHITADGYTQTQNARAKVGEAEPTHLFYLHDVEKDTIYLIDFSALPQIRKKPEFLKEYGDFEENYKENRKIVFHAPISSKNGITVMDIRSYDNKDRWIVEISPENHSFTVLDHQHDEAWIGGPGISSWNRSTGTLGFWNEDKSLYFQSEATGFSHLYSYDFQSKKSTQLTEGKFEIHEVFLAKSQREFYLTTNTKHPGNRELYKFNPEKKSWAALLTKEGAYSSILSPTESHIAVIYSDKTHPDELFIGTNSKSVVLTQITESRSEKFKSYAWQNPEVIKFSGEDGKPVFARLYQPKKENRNKAAVIFVHGAGYLQNAHNYWSDYYREYMFHNLLTDKGYTVLDIDYRASLGYGRDHRTAIYRYMGGWDLEDHITGKNLLVDSLGIDSNRVGIYGGSYGGFITLMALLTRPNEFACGAALRSVTDWRHYNHEYTSNILNYPNNDSIAYSKSSPIYYAENLNKPLLMLHGMVDDNVQFQDVVRLGQRFIELGKKDWELSLFPVEAHGFVRPYSWTDEYRRILELFEKELH